MVSFSSRHYQTPCPWWTSLLSTLPLAIQAELSRSNELDKTHLDQHFEDLLVRINTLERKLTDSTDFIPGYDQRQFSLVSWVVDLFFFLLYHIRSSPCPETIATAKALRTLKDSLAVSRGNLTPKTKFSFKSRSKKIANSTTNTKQTRPVDGNRYLKTVMCIELLALFTYTNQLIYCIS